VRRPGHARSDAGSRRLSFGELVADELFQHRARSSFKGDDERMFCHPYKRRPMNPQRYATNATQLWLASASRAAMPTRLGHANFSTTEGYIHAAKELYREEAVALEERMFGHTVGHNGASPP